MIWPLLVMGPIEPVLVDRVARHARRRAEAAFDRAAVECAVRSANGKA